MPQDILSSDAHLNTDGFIEQAYDQVKSMLKENVPPREILARLATAAEDLAGTGASASILTAKVLFPRKDAAGRSRER
jgi:hypothetical protein